MTELMEFLTSKEVFIVILIAISVCIISTIYFVIERIYKKHKETKENELFNTTDNKIIRIIDNKVVVEPLYLIRQLFLKRKLMQLQGSNQLNQLKK